MQIEGQFDVIAGPLPYMAMDWHVEPKYRHAYKLCRAIRCAEHTDLISPTGPPSPLSLGTAILFKKASQQVTSLIHAHETTLHYNFCNTFFNASVDLWLGVSGVAVLGRGGGLDNSRWHTSSPHPLPLLMLPFCLVVVTLTVGWGLPGELPSLAREPFVGLVSLSLERVESWEHGWGRAEGEDY